MTKPVLTPKSFFTTLTIMHLSFFVAMLFLAGIAYYLNQNHNLDFENIDIILFVVLVTVSLFGVIGGQAIKNETIEKAESKILLREKLGAYQTASLIQYAFVEGACLVWYRFVFTNCRVCVFTYCFCNDGLFFGFKTKKGKNYKGIALGT